MPELHLDHVGKIYDDAARTVALSAVDLQVAQGDFLAIEGPSGGGKSTLLNIIGLLDTPTNGHYHLDAGDVSGASERDLARARSDTFAFIFQAFHLLERRKVLDSVELGLVYRGLPPAERRRRALDALDVVRAAHLAQHKANTLSGGERQRVAIARALAADAPVVVADEPTGNLDSANGQAVTDALRLFHERGATVVLVTHSPETAAIAPRRVHLRDGTVVSDTGPTAPVSALAARPQPPGSPSVLRIRDLLVDAIASIRSRAMRSISLTAAVAVGVALAVATIGVSVSANAQVSSTFNAHANRDVTVSWPAGALDDETPAQQAALSDRLHGLAGVQSVSLVDNDGEVALQANPDRTAFQVTAYGEGGQYQSASRSSITWAPGHRHTLQPGELLMGTNLAQQVSLGPLIGEPAVSLNGMPMTVVGLVTASPRVPDAIGAVVLPRSSASDLATPTQQEALILTAPGAAQQVARQTSLATDPYSADALQVSAPVDPSTLRVQIQSDVQVSLAIFTGVALLAAIAALINTTMLAVLERRQEFGLRRAVGARPGHIFSLVLVESLLLGALGGAAGFVAGVGSVLVVTLANRWSPVFDFRIAPLAIVGGLAVGALGGVLASLRASRIRPSDALRA